MKYNILGQTGIKVSELCFGVLPMGPLQADIPPREGAYVLEQALEAGVTYFDTAQMYRTYDHLGPALHNSGKLYDVVVESKSAAVSYQDMRAAVEEALRELRRDYIDIFLLHAARLAGDPRELRAGAWQCLLDMKEKGYIRACGVSTHVVSTAQLLSRGGLDVLFALYNMTGIGLLDGSVEQMRAAVEAAAAQGVGCLSMKLLGGGNLLHKYLEAMAFGRQVSAFTAHAVGMVRRQELELNLRLFNDEQIDPDEVRDIKGQKQLMIFRALCLNCGKCVQRCPNYALSRHEDGPQVDRDRCLLCGYCADACPEFAIRIK